MMDASATLLTPGDPSPVTIVNAGGTSPFLLIGDHAGNAIPAALGTLGVGDADRSRHIGWDLGVAELGSLLAERLDAPFIAQTYSRLVVDCNRPPEAAGAMPAVSDGTPVRGNAALSADERTARIDAIHRPYHDAIAAELARRVNARRPAVLVALHSFTPALSGGGAGGGARRWHVGVLHDGGEHAFALALLRALCAVPALVVGDNEPYAMAGIDYTVPRHAYPLALAYAEIEVRQDLLAGRAGQLHWAELLDRALRAAARAAAIDAG